MTLNASQTNQSFSTNQAIPPGTYEVIVRYKATYGFGATMDNFLVTETVLPADSNYVFRLEDGQQLDGYVLTSDANGNATWKEIADSSVDQTLAYNDATKDLTIFKRKYSITF